ncbi:hypothetical protein GCM10010341_51560 [Streptomyces noursei]|nr:hypothetical protein GCM10010341_51560 [Streptomyces noursei]
MDRLIGCDRRPDLLSKVVDRAVAADDQVAAATQGFDMLFMRGTPVVEVVAQEDVEGEAVPQALALDLPGQAQVGRQVDEDVEPHVRCSRGDMTGEEAVHDDNGRAGQRGVGVVRETREIQRPGIADVQPRHPGFIWLPNPLLRSEEVVVVTVEYPRWPPGRRSRQCGSQCGLSRPGTSSQRDQHVLSSLSW